MHCSTDLVTLNATATATVFGKMAAASVSAGPCWAALSLPTSPKPLSTTSPIWVLKSTTAASTAPSASNSITLTMSNAPPPSWIATWCQWPIRRSGSNTVTSVTGPGAMPGPLGSWTQPILSPRSRPPVTGSGPSGDLWDEIRATAGEEKQVELFKQILEIWSEELPSIGFFRRAAPPCHGQERLQGHPCRQPVGLLRGVYEHIIGQCHLVLG